MEACAESKYRPNAIEKCYPTPSQAWDQPWWEYQNRVEKKMLLQPMMVPSSFKCSIENRLGRCLTVLRRGKRDLVTIMSLRQRVIWSERSGNEDSSMIIYHLWNEFTLKNWSMRRRLTTANSLTGLRRADYDPRRPESPWADLHTISSFRIDRIGYERVGWRAVWTNNFKQKTTSAIQYGCKKERVRRDFTAGRFFSRKII